MNKLSILFIFFVLFSITVTISKEDDEGLVVEDDEDKSNLNQNQKIEDNDEFEIITNKKSSEEEIDPIQESQKYHEAVYNQSNSRFHSVTHYEILMLTMLVAYLLNCYLGKSKNDKFAEQWYNSSIEFYKENYGHIGVGSNDTNLETPFLKESYYSYKFFASGRVNTKSLLTSIELKKRHDLVSILSSLFVYQEKDRLNFEFALDQTLDLPSVFILCKPKDLKSLKKSYSDIEYFTKPSSPEFISEKFTLYSENSSHFIDLFEEKQLLNSYRKIEDILELIYYTDRKTFCRDQFAIYFSFDLNLDSKGLNEKIVEINKFIHIFIDRISLTKIPLNDRKEADRKRNEYMKLKHKEKSEKQIEEYKEKKQKEKEEKLKNLSKEKILKLEEKERERELKKMQHKKVKMVKF